jgi:uncharacterized protein (TIGR02266 family)
MLRRGLILPGDERRIDMECALSASATALDNRQKILLVDDAELFLDLEKSILARENLSITTASDGYEALAAIAKEIPDLVFLDMFMPRMNGDECCRRIKETPGLETLPVVIVTGRRDEECQTRCREAGCDAVLQKPIDRQKMVELVRTHLPIEERRGPRVPTRMRIRYGFEGQILTDYTVNLSAGGLYLETAEPLPEKTKLQISFELPEGGKQIFCHGQVAWVNEGERRNAPHLPPGMGIQFLHLGLAEMKAIREYLTKREICSEW